MRNILYVFSLLVACILVGGTAYAEAPPCPDLPAVGDEYICYFVNGQKVVGLPGGPIPGNSNGSARVRVANIIVGDPCQVVFEVLDFNSNGTGEFGTIDANLVPTAAPTTLTGNPGTGRLFPATLDLNIELEATVSSLGGQSYRSIGPLNLQASGINSLPLEGVDVTQTRPLEFYSEEGEVTFRLEQTDVTLNP